MRSILIIEDDPAQLRLYSQALERFQLTCVPDGKAALRELNRALPDLIILDNVLAGGGRGVDLLPHLKDAAAHVPVIVITGTMKIRDQVSVLQGPRSAHYILEKPVELDELDQTVEAALSQCGLGEALNTLRSLEGTEKLAFSDIDRRFTDRLTRHHKLINQLRGEQQRANVSELSRQYEVSRKTIIRDLKDLIQRGQIPEANYPEWQTADDGEE